MIENYVERLSGPYYLVVQLPSHTDIRAFVQKIRIQLRIVASTSLSYFWFKSAQGIVLVVSGSRLVAEYIKGHYLESAVVKHYSRSRKRFESMLSVLIADRITTGHGIYRGNNND